MEKLRRLHVVAGLHEGACVDLRSGTYVLGSGEDCDIVLRDAAVAARHLRLHVDGGRVRIKPLEGAALQCKGRALSSGRLAADYEICAIGAAQFYFSSALASQSTAASTGAQPSAHSSPSKRGRFARPVYATCAALAAATLFAYAHDGWRGRDLQPAAALAQARARLGVLKLNDLNASLNARGQLVLSGYVRRAHDAQRLRHDKSLHVLGAPLMQFHVAEELVARLRQDLDAPGVSADYLGGGNIALRGSAPAALKAKVQALRRDLAQVVALEDRIDYQPVVATQPGVRSAPLPVRIVAVHVGAVSYFEDAEGARYFVGGSLRDGAQVTAITESAISFSKNGQIITHQLDEGSAYARL